MRASVRRPERETTDYRSCTFILLSCRNISILRRWRTYTSVKTDVYKRQLLGWRGGLGRHLAVRALTLLGLLLPRLLAPFRASRARSSRAHAGGTSGTVVRGRLLGRLGFDDRFGQTIMLLACGLR